MKNKQHLFLGIMVLLVGVLFVPIPKTDNISGAAQVLSAGGEKNYIGTSKLSVEIHEWKSLLITYRRTFSFAVDDEQLSDLKTVVYDEIGDCVWIHQGYYDADKNGFTSCTLGYQKDLSRVELKWNDCIYIVSAGEDVMHLDSEFFATSGNHL